MAQRLRFTALALVVVLTIAVATLVASCGAPALSRAQGPGSITHIADSFGEDGRNYDAYEIISPSGLICVVVTSDPSGGSVGGPVSNDCEKK